MGTRHSASDGSTDTATDSSTWPWSCLRCGTTIYHDVLYCRACERTVRSGRPAQASTDVPASALEEWVRWARRQSYPAFTAKVTAIAGIEVGLTAVWLQLLWFVPGLAAGGL